MKELLDELRGMTNEELALVVEEYQSCNGMISDDSILRRLTEKHCSEMVKHSMFLIGATSIFVYVAQVLAERLIGSKNLNINTSVNMELIDLGLSVKWAKCNLGAEHEWEYGNYYACGDIEGFNEDSIHTDAFTEDWYTQRECSKYDKDILDNEHDAAYVATGGAMRMPTNEEMEELFNSDFVIKEITTINGIKGTKFTSTKEGYVGNYIFIPFAGCGLGGSIDYAGYISNCWSSSVDDSDYALDLYCDYNCYMGVENDGRYFGYSVRGVSE